MSATPEIEIEVETSFLEDESQPQDSRFIFAYTVTITNRGEEAIKLLTRHWNICDANEKVQEVHGEGVVGRQPHLGSGQSFQYSSGAILETAVGTMQGNYEFITDSGNIFSAPIPAFLLADPTTLH